jgi:hypothetical protein
MNALRELKRLQGLEQHLGRHGDLKAVEVPSDFLDKIADGIDNAIEQVMKDFGENSKNIHLTFSDSDYGRCQVKLVDAIEAVYRKNHV